MRIDLENRATWRLLGRRPKDDEYVLTFDPKEDLTAFELATIQKQMTGVEKIVAATAEDYNAVREKLGAAFRHFRLEENHSDEEKAVVRSMADLMGRPVNAGLLVEIARRLKGARA